MTASELASTAIAPPTPVHDHQWWLRSVDFSDGVAVEEFGCVECTQVWFR